MTGVGAIFPALCEKFDNRVEQICGLHGCVFKRVYNFNCLRDADERDQLRNVLTYKGVHKMIEPIASTYKRKVVLGGRSSTIVHEHNQLAASPFSGEVKLAQPTAVQEPIADDDHQGDSTAQVATGRSKRSRPGRQHNKRLRKASSFDNSAAH